MGQYYRAMLLDGPKYVLSPYDYDNGAKLMEHSWVGNEFVNAVYSMIVETSKRIAWMGDYSGDKDGDRWEKKIEEQFGRSWFEMMFSYAWGEDSEETHGIIPLDLRTESRGWYLCNEDQKVYINLSEYYAISKEKIEVYNGGKKEERDECIDPLPLLTACGNGRGGGDYGYKYPSQNMIGAWAFDRIRLTRVLPYDYALILPVFKEKEVELE